MGMEFRERPRAVRRSKFRQGSPRATVKRWGKSPPAAWQHAGSGKPAWCKAESGGAAKAATAGPAAPRAGRVTRVETRGLDRWPLKQNPAYGPLAFSI